MRAKNLAHAGQLCANPAAARGGIQYQASGADQRTFIGLPDSSTASVVAIDPATAGSGRLIQHGREMRD